MNDATRPVTTEVALEPAVVEGDWEYQPVRLPPDVSRLSATTELGLRSQFGGWELARTLLDEAGHEREYFRPVPPS